MTATLPLHKPQRALAVFPASIIIALALSPFVMRIGMEFRDRASIESQFESKRELILRRVDDAVNRHDLATLTRLNNKYSGKVTDGAFLTALHEALAKVTAREAEMQLAVARHLDLSRCKEQSPLRFDSAKPQLSAFTAKDDQQLSKLPR